MTPYEALTERARNFLRQSAPHHRSREWHQIIEALLDAILALRDAQPQPTASEAGELSAREIENLAEALRKAQHAAVPF